ncbi:MAG TPA: Fic family protein, partial [Patescibacteria group bacterium]|nr:Fic family protein [Patescibacteria group bacterium]
MEKRIVPVAAQFVRESNLIENIDVSYETIAKELGEEKKDGHVGALLLADANALTGVHISENMLCEWQGLIIQEQNTLNLAGDELIDGRHIGQYRDCWVTVGGRLCVLPEFVNDHMKELLERIQLFQKARGKLKPQNTIKYIADFHHQFLLIHPFVDGNGRTSRLLVWYLFSYFGLKPFIFTSSDRHETYYRAFDGMREY